MVTGDTCFDLTSVCYSPDNPPSFAFCGYHGSVTYSDIGHVLLSVEPFQNVDGCSVTTPTPNGALVDSTANVLSIEAPRPSPIPIRRPRLQICSTETSDGSP